MLITLDVFFSLHSFNLTFQKHYDILYTENKERGKQNMIKYVIQCETGLQGCSYYERKEEAIQAAQWRRFCTGLEWFVREIITR